MLIVNADDFGASPTATDPILETIAAGAVSSTSAMVWMRDTGRAAELAREHGTEVGLHLNLTMAFNDPAVPRAAAERQQRWVQVLDKETWWRGTHHDLPPRELRAAVDEQIERFIELFGEPSHINGHHHIHVIAAVRDVLPPHVPIRQLPVTPGTISQSSKQIDAIATRFRTAWRTLDFTALHPQLGGQGFAVLHEFADRLIEVVVHPQLPEQRAALLGASWLDTVGQIGLSSFRTSYA